MIQRQIDGEVAWSAWAVNWSAVWVGALASLAAALVFGLAGTALGTVAFKSFTSWHTISLIDVAAAILAAFFAFVIGGWAAGKIAGFRHAEPAILHASIAWLVAVPIIVVLMALGAGSAFGAWYGGIAAPVFAAAPVAPPSPELVRATALAGLTSILIGLVGSVIGGWIASGEPMTFTHYRGRTTRWSITEGDLP